MKCPQCFRDDCEAPRDAEYFPFTVDMAHAVMDCNDAQFRLPRGFFCPMCGDGSKIAEGQTCMYCGEFAPVIPF